MVRPPSRLSYWVASAVLAVVAVGSVVLVTSRTSDTPPAAVPGSVTQSNACQWIDPSQHPLPIDVPITLGGLTTPDQPAYGDTVTLGQATISGTLPWWVAYEAYFAGFIVNGPNTMSISLDLTLRATNATPAVRTVTIPATVSVNFDAAAPYTEAGQAGQRLSIVDLAIPDTTWVRTGQGTVDFSQGSIVIRGTLGSMGPVTIFDGCYPASWIPGDQPTPVPVTAPVFESAGIVLPDARFSDVPYGHTFFGDIEWMAASGISLGYTDGTFLPANPVSRQGFASFLYSFAQPSGFTPPAVPTFPDVGLDHQFYTAIEWAYAEGIVAGNLDGTFGPGNAVTRQAAAQWIYRYEDPVFTAPSVPTFTDVGTGHVFYDAIEWMSSTRIASGYNDGSFGPTIVTSRQAASALIHRAAIWGS